MSQKILRDGKTYDIAFIGDYCRGLTKRITPVKFGGGYTGWGWHWEVASCLGRGVEYHSVLLQMSHPDGRRMAYRFPLTARSFNQDKLTSLVIALAEVMGITADHILAELRGERKPSRAKVKKIR